MLVNFIGCPKSGKTTTAAMLFAELKRNNTSAEFISEQSRIYIANKRVRENLLELQPLKLNDTDQVAIMTQQLQVQTTMLQACGKYVQIIADSSPINSLLYMSDSTIQLPEVQNMIQRTLATVDLFFVLSMLPAHIESQDPNRIHSTEEIQTIDSKVIDMLQKYAPNARKIMLYGDMKKREFDAIHNFYELSVDLYSQEEN